MSETTDIKTQTLDAFISMLDQFLSACAEVWPEDTKLSTFRVAFGLIKNPLARSAQEEIINDYYNSLRPYFKRCSDRDVTLFTEDNDISFLNEVDMRSKWLDNSVGNETREIIWEYVLELNKLSQMCVGLFSRIPSTTLNRIQETAMTLAGKISSGELSAGDLDLSSIGQSVVDGLSEEEIASFTENLLGDPSALASLASGMADTSGLNIDPIAMAQAMAMGSGGGAGSAGDAIAMAMQMIQSQQGSGAAAGWN